MKSLQTDRGYGIALFKFLCLACTSCFVACAAGSTIAQSKSGKTQESNQAPKNVILLIGDGMGSEQVKAAGMYAYGTPGKLPFEQFPHQGEVTTYSANSSITDSAAGGTAIATGVKVNNGVISMAIPGNGQPLETILEKYQGAGKSTGLVTTTEMTHATPAVFAAHQKGRLQQGQIAQQYLNVTRPEVLFGGGGAGMSPAAAESAGYQVVTNRQQMQALDTEKVTRVSGQFGQGHLPYEYDGVGDLPHLREMTQTALNILDNDPDGLFLMVEGGRIDHAGHENDLERNVRETLQFAETVTEVLKWAENHPDTLVIVTGDHETGGLKVLQNNGQGKLPQVSWSSQNHTGINVPIYGWGVNSDRVTGILDNTDIFNILLGQYQMTEP